MPKRLDPGRLRHLLTWEKVTPGPLNSSRQATTNHSPQGTFRAAVEALRGAEVFSAAQSQATSTYKITMWNVGPIGPKDRLVYEDDGLKRVFNVVTVFRPLDPSDPYLTITADELMNP